MSNDGTDRTTESKGDIEMDLALKALERIDRGHAAVLWGSVVIRTGDRYIVGGPRGGAANYRAQGVSIDEAAFILVASDGGDR